MVIASVMNNSVLLIAIFVFINRYEVRRIGRDRKKKLTSDSWEKNRFVKCGDFFQYEEYESTFSKGSTSLAEISSSNIKK